MKRGRHLFLVVLFVLAVAGLCYRLVYLHIIEDDFLQSKGDVSSKRTLTLQSYRGMIVDRNGQVLAVSTPVKSIWVNVNQVDLRDQNWGVLANMVNVPKAKLFKKITTHAKSSFLYLKRHTTPQIAEKISNLHLAGVYSQTETARFYPMGAIFSHIVGHTGMDHKGQEGVELAFNHVLEGKPGNHRVLKDRAGHSVESIGAKTAARLGEDIVLSLDARIQYLAYKELLIACKQHQAKSASLVVLDVENFDILAMVNVPGYNPHHGGDYMRNRAVTDQFEPGSVIKPFSMLAILSRGFTPDTRVDTSPGLMMIGNKIVKDIHNYGEMNLTQIIQKSSNVGIAKLMGRVQPQSLYHILGALGFGQVTDSGLPGEQAGRITDGGQKNPFALATLAFGYGMSITPLQLAQSYAILASGGKKLPINLIKSNKLVNMDGVNVGERVLDEKITKIVNQMLLEASEIGGTAYKARVPGYTIAGKTGTVRKVVNNGMSTGYSEDKHMAIFAGFAPTKHPKVVIAVIIDEPLVKYYGGEVAAPVFSKVMEGALRILAVPREDNLLS